MDMHKVLYVITKANWGGAQRYVYDLATSLPKSEHEVAVVLGGNGALKERLAEKNVRTIPIPALQRNVSISKEIDSFFQLLAIFQKEKPHTVHLNSSKAGGLGAVAARLAGVQNIIFTVHGWPFWERRNLLVRGLIWLFSWLTALFSHIVICISEYDAEVARAMPFIRGKVVRIYNGIASLHVSSGSVIRNAFPEGVKITGTIGELNANKNQIALIEEARKNSEMYVAVVGEGELRAYLEEKITKYGLKERVKLFGFMPAQEVLRGFDVFALPSLKEGLPYVLLEAKAAGLLITANRVGGVPEILDAKNMSEFSLETMLAKTVSLYRDK